MYAHVTRLKVTKMVAASLLLLLQLLLALLVSVAVADNSEDESSGSKPLSILLLAGLYPGHLFPLVSLGEELVRRGHSVTLCANVMNGSHLYPGVPERVGIQFVSAGYDTTFTQDGFDELHIAMQSSGMDLNVAKKLIHVGYSTYINIRVKVEEIGVENYDIVVCEGTLLATGVYFHRKGAKVVVLSTQLVLYPSVMPDWPTPLPNLQQSDDLSFLERFSNALLFPFLGLFFREMFQSVTRVDARYEEGLKGVDLLDYPGLHVPLIVTSAFGFDYPKPRQPLVDFVGPVMIASLPALSEDMVEWLDAKEEKTVIYISMGTTGSLTRINAEALLNGVMSSGYSALWVIKAKNREILSQLDFDAYGDRLLLAEWVSQQTVLQHKSILLSILHCGLNGVQESLYNSLPVICIPCYYDHFEIAAKVASAGVGISLLSLMNSGKELEAGGISRSIGRIMSDGFAENASRVGQIFKVAGGGKRAADLVEFYADVGFDHLVPSFVKYKWSWVQYYNADVSLVFVGGCALLCWLLWRVVYCVCRSVTNFV
jgi:glucuronosyltransferase